MSKYTASLVPIARNYALRLRSPAGGRPSAIDVWGSASGLHTRQALIAHVCGRTVSETDDNLFAAEHP